MLDSNKENFQEVTKYIKDIKLDDLVYMGYNECYDLIYSLALKEYIKKNNNIDIIFEDIPGLYFVKNYQGNSVTSIINNNNYNTLFVCVTQFKKNSRMIDFVKYMCNDSFELTLSKELMKTYCYDIPNLSNADITKNEKYTNYIKKKIKAESKGEVVDDFEYLNYDNLRYNLGNDKVNVFMSNFKNNKIPNLELNMNKYNHILIEYIRYNKNFYNYNVLKYLKFNKDDLYFMNQENNLKDITNDELFEEINKGTNFFTVPLINNNLYNNYQIYNSYDSVSSNSLTFYSLFYHNNINIISYTKLKESREKLLTKYYYKHVYEYLFNNSQIGVVVKPKDFKIFKLKTMSDNQVAIYFRLFSSLDTLSQKEIFKIFNSNFTRKVTNVRQVMDNSLYNLELSIPLFVYQYLSVIIIRNETEFNEL